MSLHKDTKVTKILESFSAALREGDTMEKPNKENQKTDTTQNVIYGEFWRRVAAFLINVLILGMVAWGGWAHILFCNGFWGLGVPVVLSWLYCAGFESSPLQATPGKLAIGLRVVDMDGRRISFTRASVRYFGFILLFVLVELIDLLVTPFMLYCSVFLWLLCALSLFIIPFNVRKRGLHDFIAKTCVVQPRVSAWANGTHIALTGIVCIAFVLVCLSPAISNKMLHVNLMAIGTQGKDIYSNLIISAQAMTQGKTYITSTDYFNDLLKVTTNKVDMKWFAGAGVPHSKTGVLTAENNMWAVLVNTTDEDSDKLPLLITRNVDIDELNRALAKGITSKDENRFTRMALRNTTPLHRNGCVMIRKNGTVFSLTAKHCMLWTIFGCDYEIPPRPESEPPLMYLQP